jgi:hypothetical protein
LGEGGGRYYKWGRTWTLATGRTGDRDMVLTVSCDAMRFRCSVVCCAHHGYVTPWAVCVCRTSVARCAVRGVCLFRRCSDPRAHRASSSLASSVESPSQKARPRGSDVAKWHGPEPCVGSRSSGPPFTGHEPGQPGRVNALDKTISRANRNADRAGHAAAHIVIWRCVEQFKRAPCARQILR